MIYIVEKKTFTDCTCYFCCDKIREKNKVREKKSLFWLAVPQGMWSDMVGKV